MVPADDAEGVPGAKTGRRRAAPDAGAGDCVGNPPVVEAAEAAEVADAPVGAIPEDRADGAADRARPPGAGREAGAAGAEAREPSCAPALGSPGRATMESLERADAELASDAPVPLRVPVRVDGPVSMGWVGAPPRSRALSSASVADTRAPPGAVGDAAGAVPAGGGVAGRAAAGRGGVAGRGSGAGLPVDGAPLAPDRGAAGRACGVEEVVALSGAADGR